MYSAIGVEPTKLTAWMSGLVRIASTASLSPCTTLSTPSGRPAFFSRPAMKLAALGDLEYEGVAAGERDREHPHRHHGGEVEGRNAGDDTERLADRIGIDVG